VTGRSTGAASVLAAAAGSYRADVLDQLWQSMPEEMRIEVLHPDCVPPRFRGAFRLQRNHPAGIDLSLLPPVMAREIAWCLFRIADGGGLIQVKDMRMLIRRMSEVVADSSGAAPVSLTDLSFGDWQQWIARAAHRRTGTLPAPGSARIVRANLQRCYRLLDIAYDARPWWRRDEWDPLLDQRIPRRQHEPLGRQVANFTRITQPWLRQAAQWYCKTSLDTGALTWSTVLQRVHALAIFAGFLTERGVAEPWLDDDPARLRALMLDFLGTLRSRRVAHAGPTCGQPLSAARLTLILVGVEQFYAFMHDHQHTAAAALNTSAWLRLGPQHARLFRRGEHPRQDRNRHGPVIDDDAFAAIMAGIGTLGTPTAEGGLGDEQAMRILMLLARTGRRANEILMLDRDPLLPIGSASTFAARLRYQQTKIDGGPDTILVDDEIVSIIRAQQRWADAYLAEHAAPGTQPIYLFLAERMNRNADRPYPSSRLRTAFDRLAHVLDIRDATGTLVNFQRTHRFRHTKATSLQMSRVASVASFGKIRELLPPATSPFGLDQGRLVETSSHTS
jgi:integrase